ncbi:hypothetical protein [Nocardiopsis sp. MG754419]|uniref:hypothetical protein n=1 Tax=Nocardiopsis sp. MG754419 TaxID=2259865 RepID=UPI001BAD07D5|nr:hypothetical protein [Nocardiopsis sp. MG754419]MBR8740401.1 hypothetical protein [Nocardiopsis sp. MG754419]
MTRVVERGEADTTLGEVRPPGFGAALGSEWRKFPALPANRVMVLVALLLTAGVSALMVVFGDSAALAREQAEGEYAVVFFGSHFATLAFAALAAHVIASEYRGLAVYTLTATPRRWRPLVAKLVVVSTVGAAVGLVVSLVSFAITQGVLAMAGEESLSLTAPGMLRAVLVFVPLGTVVQSLLTACAAVVLRSAPGAFVAVLLLGLLPVSLAPFLGPWWGENVPRYMTGAAVESVAGMTVPGSEGHLPTLAAVAVIVVWVCVFVAGAVAVFSRRDV